MTTTTVTRELDDVTHEIELSVACVHEAAEPDVGRYARNVLDEWRVERWVVLDADYEIVSDLRAATKAEAEAFAEWAAFDLTKAEEERIEESWSPENERDPDYEYDRRRDDAMFGRGW